MDRVEFLAACLDEDERLARAAMSVSGAGDWALDGLGRIYSPSLDREISGRLPFTAHTMVTEPPDECFHDVFSDQRAADHCVRHDPDRALAQVAAYRAILARHRPKDDPPWGTVCEGCGYEGPNDDPRYLIDECPELRDLVMIYADRDGYDESWRPD